MINKSMRTRGKWIGLVWILAAACNCFDFGWDDDDDESCIPAWDYDAEDDWGEDYREDHWQDDLDLVEEVETMIDLREMDLFIGECYDLEICNGLDDDCNGIIDDVKGEPFCGDECCNGGETALSCARDCTCDSPSTPLQLTPHNGDKVRTTYPAFRWEASFGSCGEPYYELQIDDSCPIADYPACTFPSPEIDESEILGTAWSPVDGLGVFPTPPVRARYFWRVRSCYADRRCSPWSPVRYVDVGSGENDLDGDGLSDLAVGAETAHEGEAEEGKVFLIYGTTDVLGPAPPVVLSSPSGEPLARFGVSIAGSGDLDGDGFCDLAVGADYHDGSEVDEGLVAVYSGTETGVPPEPTLVLETPLRQTLARFGASLSSGGDLDGDGFDDLVVGAEWADVEARNEGAVFIFPGSGSGIGDVPGMMIANPEHQEGGHFGKSVSSGGDINDDGYDDLAVGADFQDGAAGDSGKVYVYFGSPGGVDETPSIVLESPFMSPGHFGASVSLEGDVNGDGYSDLVVGADILDGDESREGAIFVYYGTNLSAGSLDFVFLESPGDQPNGRFGYSVKILGQVLGNDRYDDVAVGAVMTGTVYVLQGRDAALSCDDMETLAAPPETATSEWFGEEIIRIGDLDDEPPGDFAITGRLYSDDTHYIESVYLYFGNEFCCMFPLE